MVKKINFRFEDLAEGKIFLLDSLIISVSNNEIVTIKKDLNFKMIGVLDIVSMLLIGKCVRYIIKVLILYILAINMNYINKN
ncbi:MAG: hypothetical protein AABW90_00730 [Nanoarchaeota archaeon]